MLNTFTLFCWKWAYFFYTILLLAVEIFIALKVHDQIIRPYIGDMLVVVLCYTMCRTVLQINKRTIAIAVLLFACIIEFLQYGQFINVLGLQNNKIAKIALGSTFSFADIIMYILGFVLVYALDCRKNSTNSNTA